MLRLDAKPGDRCSNDHFHDRFTCPNCYSDHVVTTHGEAKSIDCECGARLRCEVETFESAVCTVAGLDEAEW